MDSNKANVIVDSGLERGRCCATCSGWIPSMGGLWGVCSRKPYLHTKHNREHYMTTHHLAVCKTPGPKGYQPRTIGELDSFLAEALKKSNL